MLVGVVAEELMMPLAARSSAGTVDTDIFWKGRIYEIGFIAPGMVDETASGGGENLFWTYITNGYQGIFPDLIGDPSETFYNFSTVKVPVLVSAVFAAADVFYQPDIAVKAIHPIGLFIDPDTFYPSALLSNVVFNLLIDVDVVNASIIRRDGDPLVLLHDLFNDADIVFAPSLAKGLRPGLVTEYFPDNDRIYAAGQAAFILSPAFNPGDTLFAPFVANQLNPHLVSADDTFVGPSVGTPGRLGLVVDNDLFYAASVQFAPLLSASVGADDVFMRAVIGSLPAMYPFDSVIDFADTFYVPDVNINQKLSPYLWIDVDAIMSIPAVILGQALVANVFNDTDIVYAPVLPPTLSPALFVATDNFLTPILVFDQAVSPTWFIDGDTSPAPSVSQLSSFDGTLALDGPIMPSTPQPTVIYIEG